MTFPVLNALPKHELLVHVCTLPTATCITRRNTSFLASFYFNSPFSVTTRRVMLSYYTTGHHFLHIIIIIIGLFLRHIKKLHQRSVTL